MGPPGVGLDKLKRAGIDSSAIGVDKLVPWSRSRSKNKRRGDEIMKKSARGQNVKKSARGHGMTCMVDFCGCLAFSDPDFIFVKYFFFQVRLRGTSRRIEFLELVDLRT